MQRILVLRGGALGDFILTLPALAALRSRWPLSRIELAGNAVAAQLALQRGLIDAAHSQHEARWAALFGFAKLPREFADWLAGFDLVLNFWPDPEGEVQRRFPIRERQVFLSAAALPARAPAAAHYCEPLRALGIETREYFYRLEPLDVRCADRKRVGDNALHPSTDEPPITFHPGSGSPKKNWPAQHWRRLIDEIPAKISVVLGEAELPVWSEAARSGVRAPPSSGRNRNINLLVNRPLEELVAHFTRSRLFVGHDSGISHLAAACGARCVLLFGPTDPAIWAPPAPNVRVLRCGPELASLPYDVVHCAVAEALADQT